MAWHVQQAGLRCRMPRTPRTPRSQAAHYFQEDVVDDEARSVYSLRSDADVEDLGPDDVCKMTMILITSHVYSFKNYRPQRTSIFMFRTLEGLTVVVTFKVTLMRSATQFQRYYYIIVFSLAIPLC